MHAALLTEASLRPARPPFSAEPCTRRPKRKLPRHNSTRETIGHITEETSSDYTSLSRRTALAALLAILPGAQLARPVLAEGELVQFEDKKRTYGLKRPKDWEQVDKAGADALFKAPGLRSTDLGVTVSPVRIQKLEQLGDVQAVGDRLLAAEKNKESTQSAELLSQGSRVGGSGTQFYEYDYTISTTRGDKRILAAVGVADRKLYIVNGSVKCEGASCKDATPLVQLVKQSVASFDILR